MTREEAVWYVNHTFEIIKEELCNSGRFDEAKEFEIAQNMAIEALSVEVVQGWIPVSEKLPRTGDDIFVTFSDGEVDIIIGARPKAWVKYEEANNLIFPVAWMPLPEPYKDGDNE